MNTTLQLEHFYHGKLFPGDGGNPSGFTVTALSPGLTLEESSRYIRIIQPGSYAGLSLEKLRFGMSFISYDPQTYLISAYYPAALKDRGVHPDYHCVVVPRYIFESLDPLKLCAIVLAYFRRDLNERRVFTKQTTLEPLHIREVDALHDVATYLNLLKAIPGITSDAISFFISATQEGRAIQVLKAPNDPENVEQQLILAMGLLALLPRQARHILTFATDVFDAAAFKSAKVKILYSDPLVKQDGEDIATEWGIEPPPVETSKCYATLIAGAWQQGPAQTIRVIDEIENRLDRAANQYEVSADIVEVTAQSFEVLKGLKTHHATVEAAANAVVQDYLLSLEEQAALMAYITKLATMEQVSSLAVNMLAYPGSTLRIVDLVFPLIEQHLSSLDSQSWSNLVTTWELELSESNYDLGIFLTALLPKYLTKKQISSLQNQVRLHLARISFKIMLTPLASRLLEDAVFDSNDNEKLKRDIAEYIYQIEGDAAWSDESLATAMTRLWQLGWKNLTQEEALMFLRNIRAPDIETEVLRVIVSWLPALDDNQARIELMQNIITVLQEKFNASGTR